MTKRNNKKSIPGQSSRENHVVAKAVGRTTVMESRVMAEDAFKDYYGDSDILEPLYTPEQLARLTEESDILQQLIDAYKTNIVGFGVNVESDVDYEKLTDSEKKPIDAEKIKMENLIKYCNFDESFSSVMKKVIVDRESIGYGCIEVVENNMGEPAGFTHVPAHQVRMCKKQNQSVEVPWKIKDDNGNEIESTIKKKFRKFVQIIDEKKVYFKEFGDPRTLNCRTGEYTDNIENSEDEASSIIFFNIYCSYTPYGLPRIMGQLLNIVGSREAAELNFKYFKDGRHVPSAILVQNGKLTEASTKALEEGKGKNAQHKWLILEAEGNENEYKMMGDDTKSQVSIDIKPLATMLQEDGLFQNYCNNNRDHIRSAFRLPPLYTGESQDYTRATADTARQVTEEQVFQPEREELETKLNNLLKNALNIQNVSLRFASPTISDDSAVATAVKSYAEYGAATPNAILDALGRVLGKKLEPFEEDWGNIPLPIYLKMMEKQQQETTNNPVSDREEVEKADNTQTILDGLEALKKACEEQINEDE